MENKDFFMRERTPLLKEDFSHWFKDVEEGIRNDTANKISIFPTRKIKNDFIKKNTPNLALTAESSTNLDTSSGKSKKEEDSKYSKYNSKI